MDQATNKAPEGDGAKSYRLKGFLTSKWMIIGVLGAVAILWAAWMVYGFLEGSHADKTAGDSHPPSASPVVTGKKTDLQPQPLDGGQSHAPAGQEPSHGSSPPGDKTPKKQVAVPHQVEPHDGQKTIKPVTIPHGIVSEAGKGFTFVEACIKSMDYELNKRFWGWRPNDILNFTDNVNNLQLGVLEVTRRAAVALAENISRTGSTDAYVPSLEQAMNWFMVNSTQYWFPSAESCYQEGIDKIKEYLELLKNGKARFYSRLDNMVPLLKAFESVLGSCDENLVKDQGKLSFFRADDYFYYTKGVAQSMVIILEAVEVDFKDTVQPGEELLHHAIASLHHAAEMDPWLVLEGSPDGFLANHRSNMASHISHARFFLGVLVRTLTGSL